MLAGKNITVPPEGSGTPILHRVDVAFAPGKMNALIGPSGCGKTTLVKALLGIQEASGEISAGGQPLRSANEMSGLVGFAPQFSIAQDDLTVLESLNYAFDLFVADPAAKTERVEEILRIVGLEAQRDSRVRSLSGGQLRRIGLGLELVYDPACLVCDEVTSGLDPLSENQILDLLARLCQERGKTVVSIIHNLAKLDRFDLITVIFEGRVVFQGDYPALLAHFSLDDPLHLYDVLNETPAHEWEQRAPRPPALEPAPVPEQTTPAGFLGQFVTLLKRRMLLFLRDRAYLGLTAAITIGFPCLVVIFALDGLPQIERMALQPREGLIERTVQNFEIKVENFETAQLVTGLIMFQVILLTLMGSNNGAREIAAERRLYEKERLSGLSPMAYALSKVVFTALPAVVQGVWMTVFVKAICKFPGPAGWQIALLAGVCVAMTWVCLAFSAWFRSAERASLLSIYLVGFQLPLSGVVLALPSALEWLCRPFIICYWGWAGYLSSMLDSGFWDAFRDTSSEWVPNPAIALAMLGLHAAIGATLVLIGCRRRMWDG